MKLEISWLARLRDSNAFFHFLIPSQAGLWLLGGWNELIAFAVENMNLVELFTLCLAVGLSAFVGQYSFRFIGWWALIVGPVVGFGFVIALIWLLNKLISERRIS